MNQPATAALNRRRIVGIQLSGHFPDICYKVVMPDYGICIIGSVLAEKGHEVDIFIEHIEPPDWDVVASAGLVLMSTFSASARRTYELADRIRSELNIPVVMGGTHATYFVEDCLNHCDVVVLREGDETVVDLADALFSGRSLSTVPGIGYWENGRIRKTTARRGPAVFDTIQDYRLIRGLRKFSWLEVLRRFRVPLVTIQSSRGCPFHCSFCIVDTMFDGYRVRSIESIIDDLRQKRSYGRELLFVDNYFGADPDHAKQLLKRIVDAGFGFDIMVLCRINIAGDPELLTLMREAGVSALYLGIESIQPETLKKYAKGQSVQRIRSAIEAFHCHGFRVSGSFVVGADTDTPATIAETVRFVTETGIEVCYFFPLWGHYVERKLGNRPIVPRHRSIFRSWDYCDGNFVTHFPLQMRPSELQQAVIDAHRKVYAPSAILEAAREGNWPGVKGKATNLYAWKFIEKGLRGHIPWLREVEEGFYDATGRLLEDRLVRRVQRDPPPWLFPEIQTSAGATGAGAETEAASHEPRPPGEDFRCAIP